MAVATFSLENCRIIVNGRAVQGLSEEAVKVSFPTDNYAKKIGTHNETRRNAIVGALSPEISFSCVQGSSANDVFEGMLAADRQANNGIGQIVIDTLNGEFFVDVTGWVKKNADITLSGSDVQVTEWMLDCDTVNELRYGESDVTIPANVINAIS